MLAPLHLPGMLCGVTGSVLELRVWVKISFESSGLGFCCKHASAKRTVDFREKVILVMK